MKSKTTVLAMLAALSVAGITWAEKGSGDPLKVVKVHRDAEFLGGGERAWKPASTGTDLAADDSLKTLNNSYADMQLDPPNVFRLKENSLLKIQDLNRETKDPDGSVLKLVDLEILQGDLLAKLDRLPSGTRLNLRSPVAIATVRGTVFSLGYATSSRTTSLSVSRGSVRVQAAGEPDKLVELGAQRQATVAPWGNAVIEARGTGLPPQKLLVKRLGDPKVPLENARALLERLKKARPSLENITLNATGGGLAPPGLKDTKEAREEAISAAREEARKKIFRALKTVRLAEDETVGDLMAKDPAASAAVAASVGAARTMKERYDKKARRGSVELELGLSAVRKAIGRDISFAWRGIAPVSRDDYTSAFGGFIRVAAERAARVDAYRRLAERIFGTVLTSRTTLKNLVVENDQVEFAVQGVVQGAEEVSRTYYSDGSVTVLMRVTGAALRDAVTPVAGDVLGAHYMSSPSALDADELIDLLQADAL